MYLVHTQHQLFILKVTLIKVELHQFINILHQLINITMVSSYWHCLQYPVWFHRWTLSGRDWSSLAGNHEESKIVDSIWEVQDSLRWTEVVGKRYLMGKKEKKKKKNMN